MGNNPILKSDPLGDTTIVDNFGKIIRQVGKDNLVYLEKNAQSRKIGELGGTIDANEIYKNLLDNNIVNARQVFPWTFRKLVRGGGKWDLKNDRRSIFGLANAVYLKSKYEVKTFFQFEGNEYTAADLGNHHYGAAGKAAGFPDFILLMMAGYAQQKAGNSDPSFKVYTNTPLERSRFRQGTYTPQVPVAPYGDDPNDQEMIKKGITYFYQHSWRLGLIWMK